MSDLQPCPFCEDGGDVFEYAMFPGDVGCRECTASAPKSAWNRRAPPSADAEDAARYRWLRDPTQSTVYVGSFDSFGSFRSWHIGAALDARIDAARREGGT